jgi:hypothetical protein
MSAGLFLFCGLLQAEECSSACWSSQFFLMEDVMEKYENASSINLGQLPTMPYEDDAKVINEKLIAFATSVKGYELHVTSYGEVSWKDPDGKNSPVVVSLHKGYEKKTLTIHVQDDVEVVVVKTFVV